MTKVIVMLTLLVAVIVAAPANTQGYNPQMHGHMGGPMPHAYGYRPGPPMYHRGPMDFHRPGMYGGGYRGYGGYGGYGGNYGYGQQFYGPGFYGTAIAPPVGYAGGGFIAPGDYGDYGGGYAGGGVGYQTFHYHSERFRFHEEQATIRREATYAPAPVVRKPCYHRPRPRIYVRPACTCCCCGCNEERVSTVRYDPPVDPPDPPVVERTLTQDDVDLLQSVYKN